MHEKIMIVLEIKSRKSIPIIVHTQQDILAKVPIIYTVR